MLAPTATEMTTATTVFDNAAAEDPVITITGSTRSFKSDMGSDTAAVDCSMRLHFHLPPRVQSRLFRLRLRLCLRRHWGPRAATCAKSSKRSQLAWPHRLLRGHLQRQRRQSLLQRQLLLQLQRPHMQRQLLHRKMRGNPLSVRQCRAAQSIGEAVPLSIAMKR